MKFYFRLKYFCVNLRTQNKVQINHTSYTETELVFAVKQKDERAFSFLYDSYASALKGVVFAMIKDDALAEDIIQEAFVKIWNNIESYDDKKGRLYTWMRRIVNNLTLDSLKSKQYRQQQAVVGDELTVENLQGTNNINERINHNYLQQKLSTLDEKQNTILKMSYFDGYTQEEIAKELNMPVGTVKTKIRTAIIDLRKILK